MLGSERNSSTMCLGFLVLMTSSTNKVRIFIPGLQKEILATVTGSERLSASRWDRVLSSKTPQPTEDPIKAMSIGALFS